MNALLRMESQEDNCLFVRDQHISIVILSRPSTEQFHLLEFVDLILAIAEFAEDLPRTRPRRDPDNRYSGESLRFSATQRFPRPRAAVAQERFVPGRQGGTKSARSGREPETIRNTSVPMSASIIVANGLR
jgi:hypothetical protein